MTLTIGNATVWIMELSPSADSTGSKRVAWAIPLSNLATAALSLQLDRPGYCPNQSLVTVEIRAAASFFLTSLPVESLMRLPQLPQPLKVLIDPPSW